MVSSLDAIHTLDNKLLNISVNEALILGATLSASDVVAAVTLVSEKKTPRLHSILFGEGVLNDAIAILLFNPLKHNDLSEMSTKTFFVFLWSFFYNCTTSILLGMAFGYLSAWMLKKTTSFDKSPGN